ncbi:MAG: hypothetical protein KDD11_21790, partial [Acidobacteria bacterium]|nr:hypothetical protein [Acidobacteriota bacterium]
GNPVARIDGTGRQDEHFGFLEIKSPGVDPVTGRQRLGSLTLNQRSHDALPVTEMRSRKIQLREFHGKTVPQKVLQVDVSRSIAEDVAGPAATQLERGRLVENKILSDLRRKGILAESQVSTLNPGGRRVFDGVARSGILARVNVFLTIFSLFVDSVEMKRAVDDFKELHGRKPYFGEKIYYLQYHHFPIYRDIPPEA